MTGPLTPEELEVIRREAALYGPSADASRVGQIRLLLTELDRVTADYAREFAACASHQEVCEGLKRERDTAQASARAWQEKAVELEGALAKIDAIRNSIVGAQTLNWSAHAYPLVAALEEAGFKGEGYEIARAKALTLIQERDAALAEAKRLRDAIGAAALVLESLRITDEEEPYREFSPELRVLLRKACAKMRAALAPHPAPEPKR